MGNNTRKLPSVVAAYGPLDPGVPPVTITGFGNSPNKML